MLWLIGSAVFIVFCILDCVAYANAAYPERTSSALYLLPVGGIVALRKFGRHRGY